MKPIALLACLCLVLAARNAAGDPPTTRASAADVWILSGQSNACAKRPGQFAPPVTDKIQWYDPRAGKWTVLTGDLTGMTRTGRASPFHTAAWEAARAGRTVRMLGYSRGGAAIAHWLHQRENSGLKLLEQVVRPAGRNADVFIWYQGESDAAKAEPDPAGYQRGLTRLVGGVRKMAASPDMLAVIVQLGNWRKDKGRFHAIREAQRQFVIADGNAVLVPALGRPLADNVHLTPRSQAELGVEIGRAIRKTRHRAAGVNWPGPVLDAASRTDPRTVVAHFAEATRLSGAAAGDFKVLDADGEAACVRVAPLATTVTLTLDRPVRLPARLGYAYEQNPAAGLRDEEGNRAPAVLIDLAADVRIADEPTSAPNGAGRATPQPKASTAPGTPKTAR